MEDSGSFGGSIHLDSDTGGATNSLDGTFSVGGGGSLLWDNTTSATAGYETSTSSESSTGAEDGAVPDDFGDLESFYGILLPPIPGLPGALFDDIEVRATRGYSFLPTVAYGGGVQADVLTTGPGIDLYIFYGTGQTGYAYSPWNDPNIGDGYRRQIDPDDGGAGPDLGGGSGGGGGGGGGGGSGTTDHRDLVVDPESTTGKDFSAEALAMIGGISATGYPIGTGVDDQDDPGPGKDAPANAAAPRVGGANFSPTSQPTAWYDYINPVKIHSAVYTGYLNPSEQIYNAAMGYDPSSGGGAAAGVTTGAKAVVNGAASSLRSTATLGLVDGEWQVIEVNDQDKANGYDQSLAVARVSFDLLTTAATGGATKVLQNGGRIAKVAGKGLVLLDAAGNVVGVAKGGADIAENGLNLQNGLQVAGGALGVVGNARSLKSPDVPAAPKPVAQLSCFFARTLVATESGKKAIERVQADEHVWAFDLITSEWRLKRVLQTYSRPCRGPATAITVAGETIDSTARHPYFVVRGEDLADRPSLEHLAQVPAGATTPGRWVDAVDVRVGDELLLLDGRIKPVEQVRLYTTHETVYNFEVDDLHCYAVGNASVLVHNNNGNELAPNNVRLPQDISVNPTAPPVRPLSRPIGKSPTQNAAMQADRAAAEAAGGTDFRVNQQQVNASGQRVGTNRPDLQYTDANGKRVYVEYDTPASTRGPGHKTRIEANDPNGLVILQEVE